MICHVAFRIGHFTSSVTDPRMNHVSTFLVSLACVFFASSVSAEEYDVVIYGGTSGGVAAAVQADRMGKSVVLIEPREHVGGLSVSGLGWTDTGNKSVIGGVSREFYQRVKSYYDRAEAWIFERPGDYAMYKQDQDAIWAFEPHAAEWAFNRMLRETDVRVMFDTRLSSAVVEDGRITAIEVISGVLDSAEISGRMFIDATYEGDLMYSAGVTYAVGREANAQYGETLNGVQVANAIHHQFTHAVDPFIRPGEAASGLLPGIDDGPGRDGEADQRVQAYNFRLALTDVPENRIPFEKPEGYDPLDHELLLRNFEAGDRRIPLSILMVPNRKTDLNNNFAVSTDWIGMNYTYPDDAYGDRWVFEEQLETYVRGFLWTLQNHPRVPQEVR
ncbi:MAG: FAD-dependent oxidoreductase, partial [Planctomycetota bacterium]